MADNYLQDMMNRIAAMQLEALGDGSSYVTLDTPLQAAKPFWPYQQEALPYMINRLGNTTIDPSEYSEDIRDVNHTVLMRLVVDHITANWIGQNQDIAYQCIPVIQEYFRDHPMLTTDSGSYTSAPDYLHYECKITSHTGLVVITNFGALTPQLSVEFSLDVPYLLEDDLA